MRGKTDDPNSDKSGKIIRLQNDNHMDFPDIQLASFQKCGKSWDAYTLIASSRKWERTECYTYLSL